MGQEEPFKFEINLNQGQVLDFLLLLTLPDRALGLGMCIHILSQKITRFPF